MMKQPALGQKILALRQQKGLTQEELVEQCNICLLYTSPSPRDKRQSRMPSSA